MYKFKCLILNCLVLFSMLACRSSQAVAPSPNAPAVSKSFSGTETPEQVLKIKKNVLSNMEQSVVNGEKRFNQACVYCHGYEGSGGKAKKLQGRTLNPDRLFKTITKGKRRGAAVMPPWRKTFSISERWELVTYIMSLSEKK